MNASLHPLFVTVMSTTASKPVAWPWGGNVPLSECVQQQQINARLLHGHTYPPCTQLGAPITTSYIRFSGLGPPSDEIGRLGDIYVDHSSESPALYGHLVGWSVWPGPKVLFRHPTLDDRYLWCSEGRIAWYPGKFVVDDGRARSEQSKVQMIQQALKSEAECDPLGVAIETENQRPRTRLDNVIEDNSRPGKRTSPDREVSDGSERTKRRKIRHENVDTGETSRRQDDEDAGESDALVFLSDGPGGGEEQRDLQTQLSAVNVRPEWWAHAVARLCTRCSDAEVRASGLEATIRTVQGCCMKEEQERRRLEDICEELRTKLKNDSDKVASENRNIEALHKKEIERFRQNAATLTKKIEEDEQELQMLRENIAALTKKGGDDEKEIGRQGKHIAVLMKKEREDEKERLELQGIIEHQEQQMKTLLGENVQMKSIRDAASTDTAITPVDRTSRVSATVLSGLPGKQGQTLLAHIESCKSQS